MNSAIPILVFVSPIIYSSRLSIMQLKLRVHALNEKNVKKKEKNIILILLIPSLKLIYVKNYFTKKLFNNGSGGGI